MTNTQALNTQALCNKLGEVFPFKWEPDARGGNWFTGIKGDAKQIFWLTATFEAGKRPSRDSLHKLAFAINKVFESMNFPQTAIYLKNGDLFAKDAHPCSIQGLGAPDDDSAKGTSIAIVSYALDNRFLEILSDNYIFNRLKKNEAVQAALRTVMGEINTGPGDEIRFNHRTSGDCMRDENKVAAAEKAVHEAQELARRTDRRIPLGVEPGIDNDHAFGDRYDKPSGRVR